MARFEMNTRTNGRMKFFVPDAGGHVFLESSGRIGRSGILKRQLGAGGSFRGSMLTANENLWRSSLEPGIAPTALDNAN